MQSKPLEIEVYSDSNILNKRTEEKVTELNRTELKRNELKIKAMQG